METKWALAIMSAGPALRLKKIRLALVGVEGPEKVWNLPPVYEPYTLLMAPYNTRIQTFVNNKLYT